MNPKIRARGLFILIGIFLIGMFYLLSWGTGWRDLSRQYAARDRYQGEWITQPNLDGTLRSGPYVLLNGSESDNAIEVGADRQGLYLSMPMEYRLFHPPLFIPWSDVSCIRVRAAPWTGENLVRFTFAKSPSIPLDVEVPVAMEIQGRSEGRWTIPEGAPGFPAR